MTSQSDGPKDLPPREKRQRERAERIEGVIMGGVAIGFGLAVYFGFLVGLIVLGITGAVVITMKFRR